MFIEHLGRKKCGGSKAYNKEPEDVATLASATIKKAYDSLYLMLRTAKSWGAIDDIPETGAPSVKYKKRGFWTKAQTQSALGGMKSDRLLHLMVHIAYICSCRAGEILSIETAPIDLENLEIQVTQNIQRVSLDALERTPKDDLIRIFPPKVTSSKSRLILSTPKTELSSRTIYINRHLRDEIQARLAEIARNKRYFGEDYNDYGLLFCYENGDPIEPRKMEQRFRKWQIENECEPIIDIQALRKSSSMYKLRISGNNYQEVQGDTGHSSPQVLMAHYNEVAEAERRALARKVQADFYEDETANDDNKNAEAGEKFDLETLFAAVKSDPAFEKQFLQLFSNMQKMRNATHDS